MLPCIPDPLFMYCGAIFAFFNIQMLYSQHCVITYCNLELFLSLSIDIFSPPFKRLHTSLLWSFKVCFIILNSIGHLFIHFPNLSPSPFCSIFSYIFIISPLLNQLQNYEGSVTLRAAELRSVEEKLSPDQWWQIQKYSHLSHKHIFTLWPWHRNEECGI